MPKHIDINKEFLEEQYIKNGKSPKTIHNEFGYSLRVLYDRLRKWGLIRTQNESCKIVKHKENCLCPICKAKRGEVFGKNNSFYGKTININCTLITKEILENLYINKEFSLNEIAKELKVSTRTICRRFKFFNIPIRNYLPDRIKKKYSYIRTIEERKRNSIEKKKNPIRYWLNKSSKYILINHHIDGNKKNNAKENFLRIPQGEHRSLHFRGYDYLVKMGLIKDYIKEFIIKYDINILSNDGKLVHHIDDKRENNREDNLMYLEDRKIHNKIHQEAYLYVVKIQKIQDYLQWFFSTERRESQIILNS